MKYAAAELAKQKSDEIAELVTEVARAGCPTVGYFVAVESEGEIKPRWSIRWGDEVDDLLAIPPYRVAQVLNVLGSEVRLSILRELLNGPRAVAELVTILGFQTTGQAYHHLKELQSAGYVEQKGGKFHLRMKYGRVYVAALALAASVGAATIEEEG